MIHSLGCWHVMPLYVLSCVHFTEPQGVHVRASVQTSTHAKGSQLKGKSALVLIP